MHRRTLRFPSRRVVVASFAASALAVSGVAMASARVADDPTESDAEADAEAEAEAAEADQGAAGPSPFADGSDDGTTGPPWTDTD